MLIAWNSIYNCPCSWLIIILLHGMESEVSWLVDRMRDSEKIASLSRSLFCSQAICEWACDLELTSQPDKVGSNCWVMPMFLRGLHASRLFTYLNLLMWFHLASVRDAIRVKWNICCSPTPRGQAAKHFLLVMSHWAALVTQISRR